jgi:hypothetical protein
MFKISLQNHKKSHFFPAESHHESHPFFFFFLKTLGTEKTDRKKKSLDKGRGVIIFLEIEKGIWTMIAYQKEKTENAICFFASEHTRVTKKPLPQTFLYKYLAFLDFKSLEDTGHPALGLKYIAMERGPVPSELYNKRENLRSECYEFRKIEENKFVIVPKGRPNLEFFSPYEIKQMRRLIEIYADTFVKTSDVSEASHEDIKAWKRAWKKKKNGPIDFELQFDGDIQHKDPKDLTPAEENFLVYESIKEASN